MNINKALEIVKNKDEKRFAHVLGTYEKAKELALQYHINEYKCMLSAILHDYAKNEPIEKMKQIIKDHLDSSWLKYNPIIYHGVVGSYLLEKEYGISDQDILDAVKYHVTGHPKMNDIAKIIFIADYTEKNRMQPGVDFCRKMSQQSLDLGVLSISDHTVRYLLKSQHQNIHPLTEATYNHYLKKVGVSVYDAIRNNYKGV